MCIRDRAADWSTLPGTYEVRISASSRDIRLCETFTFDITRHVPLPEYKRFAPSYFDLSAGIKPSDQDFEALLGRPLIEREFKPGGRYTVNSTLSEIQNHWFGRILMRYINRELNKLAKTSPELKTMAAKMLADMPLRFLTTMGGGLTLRQVEGIVDILNGRTFSGLATLIRK
jgi:beta-glucosidase